MHSPAKTNLDNHLICMMYDPLFLEDESSDDLECPANTVVVILVLPVKLLVGSVLEIYCILDSKSHHLNKG